MWTDCRPSTRGDPGQVLTLTLGYAKAASTIVHPYLGYSSLLVSLAWPIHQRSTKLFCNVDFPSKFAWKRLSRSHRAVGSCYSSAELSEAAEQWAKRAAGVSYCFSKGCPSRQLFQCGGLLVISHGNQRVIWICPEVKVIWPYSFFIWLPPTPFRTVSLPPSVCAGSCGLFYLVLWEGSRHISLARAQNFGGVRLDVFSLT